jgi:peptidoglycan/xylan/chitin deacetylase (PgdA/CDA1 family)
MTTMTPIVYLTFDDGPDPNWTPRILDVLAAAQLRATFFVVGTQARRAPELLRRAVAEGHELGNHTLSHRHPWYVSAAVACQEVRDGANAIADIAGVAPHWFRPPHGRLRRCMQEEVERIGERTVLWTRSAIDWGYLGRAHRIARRLDRVAAADIVLMHDGARTSNRPDQLLPVLPGFLAGLATKGLRVGSLER